MKIPGRILSDIWIRPGMRHNQFGSLLSFVLGGYYGYESVYEFCGEIRV